MRILVAALVLVPTSAWTDVVTRIIDTGAGLATVTELDDGQIMVYDTGHWDNDPETFVAFQDFIGDREIALLVASHADSDHIAATDEIFAAYRVHQVIRTGFERFGTATWEEHHAAIRRAAELGLTHDVSYANVDLPHGTTFDFGDSQITILAGFHEPPEEWNIPRSSSEFRNANSVVIRLDYKGNSILFTGDAVGRIEGSDADSPAIGTERYLIDHRQERPIAASVLIVPHHGSDDAGSQEFISHVAARWIIFSAGHDHKHPKDVTARRFLTLGYSAQCLLRTDYGDDEGVGEWSFGRIDGYNDPNGDDHIEIRLPANGGLPVVRYLAQPAVDCPGIGALRTDPIAGEPSGGIRKSRSDICHTPDSPYYEQLVHYEAMATLQECLDSGGRVL